MPVETTKELTDILRRYPWVMDDLTEDRALSNLQIIAHLYEIDRLSNEERTPDVILLINAHWIEIYTLLNNGNPPTSVED